MALATAFVRPRKLLVLDERAAPGRGGRTLLADRLNQELADGLAVVFASHEPYLVENVATRVVHIGEGREEVERDGAPPA